MLWKTTKTPPSDSLITFDLGGTSFIIPVEKWMETDSRNLFLDVVPKALAQYEGISNVKVTSWEKVEEDVE